MESGVYEATKKNGEKYYRAGITCRGKHISLGSFDNESKAHSAYMEAGELLTTEDITLLNYSSHIKTLSLEKTISLLNFRDNHLYIKNPIYLQKGFFLYYLDNNKILKFDNDDLFYYSSHKIQKRGNHLFVADYGMQYSILSRYGIRPFAVAGRDYVYANQDETDLRYSNIIVINRYHGVLKETKKGITRYKALIHLNGDFIIGRFNTEEEAAVAYNKAVDYCKDHGFDKNFIQNYVVEYSPKEYADVYVEIKLTGAFKRYVAASKA
ncbi:MAG: hypothetical protein HUJ70_07025 [Pseudobutyrivibrio sp.]|nr:hypothetical protein [Pseudobutyrivibrio sp.]